MDTVKPWTISKSQGC